jgi:hypothetical protein
MVATTTSAKKMYDATRARVLATTSLLEEEQHTAAILTKEAHAVAALIKPPLPTPPLAPISRTAPSDDDYEATIITNIHIQATSI